MPNAPLKRSHDRMIAGVCGGLAEWVGWTRPTACASPT